MLQDIGKDTTATQHTLHNSRIVTGLCRLFQSYIQGTHVCKAKQNTADVITALQLGYSKIIHHSWGALTAYLAQWWNLLGRGTSFFLGKLTAVSQTSDTKGAVCCCLWDWATSGGENGEWGEYRKLFSTLSLQKHHSPICTGASHSFWQNA